MVESCPHSLYFFRKNFERFDLINDYEGTKTAEELTVHPNPLLVPDNEGAYYKASEEYVTTEDYVKGPGLTVEMGDYICVLRVTRYAEVTPVGTENPYHEHWYELVGTSYILTNDRTVDPLKTYYQLVEEYKFDDFGDSVTNTFRDWHIMPLGRPTISPPQQKLQTVDIPGTNGIMDLSNSLTKYPVFNNRTGNMKFAIDYDKIDWLTAYTKILRFLQGVNVRMILEDDPLYFYEGAVFIENFDSKSDGTWTELTLGYDLQPYRRSIYTSTDDDWLWDPFNFETDVIQSSMFNAIQVTAEAYAVVSPIGNENPKTEGWYEKSGTKYVLTADTTVDVSKTYYKDNDEWNELDFTGLIDTMPVIPDITVDTLDGNPMKAQLMNTDIYGNTWKNLELPEKGSSYKLYDLILCEETPESVVKMRFKNPGTITLAFRSGRL